MNLADYLSELLAQQDEVSMPGLGYFVYQKINAYYNEAEDRFYPPFHRVRFIAEQQNDETFAQYVAEKKNISLASSKYFIEKYVAKIKEDAARGICLFSGLGSFITDNGELIFKPNDRVSSDTAFYGLGPVVINKLNKTATTTTASSNTAAPTRPFIPEKKTGAPTISVNPQPVTFIPQQPYFEEEPEVKKKFSIWLIVVLAFALFIITLFAVYKYYPAVIAGFTDKLHHKADKDTTAVAITPDVKVDPLKKEDNKASDTTTKTAVPGAPPVPVTTADTAKTAAVSTSAASHFELIAGAYRTKQLAEDGVKLYSGRSLKPRILNLSEIPGPYFHVTVGEFDTDEKAEREKRKLLLAGKLYPDQAYVIEIKPKL